MKNKFLIILTTITTILFGINIYLYAQSTVLGDKITDVEIQIKQTRLRNGELEKQLYTINSVSNLEAMASVLGFTKKADPIYLDNLKLAFAK